MYYQKEYEKVIENVIEICFRVFLDIFFWEMKIFCFVWNNVG